MRIHEIETLARESIRRAKTQAPVEDLRVEFKSELIDPIKAARRLAAHANAAAYQTIIWIFGAHEDGTITGVQAADFATWFAQVSKRFDGLAPRPQEVALEIDDKIVLAVAFEAEAPPYVVTNSQGGQVTLEVPWREATGVRTANRADLLRLLSPQTKLPSIEILAGRALFTWARNSSKPKRYEGKASLSLYFSQPSLETIALPHHKISASLVAEGFPTIVFSGAKFDTGYTRAAMVKMGMENQMVDASFNEGIVRGFGKLSLVAEGVSGEWPLEQYPETCMLNVRCGVAGDERIITLSCPIYRAGSPQENDHDWIYSR